MCAFYFGVGHYVLHFPLCRLLPSRVRPLPGVFSLILYRGVFAIFGGGGMAGAGAGVGCV